MAGLIHDPEAEGRSIMMKRPALCNGQRTGRQCVHYWMHIEKVESNNADNLRLGETYRGCALDKTPAVLVHQMTANELAVVCNRFEPRRLPFYKRPLRWLRLIDDPGAYKPDLEEYRPLTPDDIREIQTGSSDPLGRDQVPMTGGIPGVTAPLSDEAVEAMVAANAKRREEQARAKRLLTADDAMAAIGAKDKTPDQGIFTKDGSE